jgi:hypothetical protein
MTAPHADTGCGGNVDAGTDRGNWAEPWPPDNQGLLQGTKFDSQRGWSTTTHTVEPGYAAPGFTRLFDLMSYCGETADRVTPPADLPTDGDHWISAYQWNRVTRRFIELGQRVPRGETVFAQTATTSGALRGLRAATRGQAFATGTVAGGGGRITRVVPPDGDSAPPAPVPGSPVVLRALDRDGRVLQEAGVGLDDLNLHGGGGIATFVGPVPVDAAAVELVRNDVVLDRLDRLRPPSVRLRAPNRRTRVRAGRELAVRWSTSDPDSGRDVAEASVDYSSDGGRTWRTVHLGPDAGHATVPGRYLERSRRARIRVAVNDGFNETRVVSAPSRADGAPPAARILAPKKSEPLRAGISVLLLGEAQDDAGNRLRGHSLTWFANRHRIGRGERLTTRLPAGASTLRLVARDRSGRRGVARREIHVPAERLRLLRLDAPLTVPRRARKVTVQVAASAPATLRAGGRRYRVRTRAGRIVLPLPRKPARGVARVRFTLVPRGSAAVGRVSGRVEVFRGRPRP